MKSRALVIHALLLAAPFTLHALEWNQNRIELKPAPFDESASPTFEFVNNTEAPVTITDIHASCGCTVPTLEKRRYEPGERGKLQVNFTFNALVGRQVKTVTVSTDEGQSKVYDLTLEVEIPKLYEMQRYFVVWRRDEAPESKSLELRILEPDLIKITGVETKNGHFSAKVQPAKEPGIYEIIVTPTNTDKVVQESLLVKMDQPPENPRVITLYALVR